jgi:hypothetical protein
MTSRPGSAGAAVDPAAPDGYIMPFIDGETLRGRLGLVAEVRCSILPVD